MMDFNEFFRCMTSWFSMEELLHMLPESDISLAVLAAAVLLVLWVLTKVLRAVVGTLCVICVLYLLIRLGLGIDPLAYLIP